MHCVRYCLIYSEAHDASRRRVYEGPGPSSCYVTRRVLHPPPCGPQVQSLVIGSPYSRSHGNGGWHTLDGVCMCPVFQNEIPEGLNRHMCMSHCVLVNVPVQETKGCLNNMTLSDQLGRTDWCPEGASMKRDGRW